MKMNIKSLTTDHPQTNIERLLNFAYAKKGRVYLRFAAARENVELCQYIASRSSEMCSGVDAESVMDGGCMVCDCPMNVLNCVAVQAATLRARLRAIEAILGDTYDLNRLRELVQSANSFQPGDHVFSVHRNEHWNPCDFSGYMLLAVSGPAVVVTPYVNDLQSLDEHLEYHTEETAENYDTHLCVFPLQDCYGSRSEAEAALNGGSQ